VLYRSGFDFFIRILIPLFVCLLRPAEFIASQSSLSSVGGASVASPLAVHDLSNHETLPDWPYCSIVAMNISRMPIIREEFNVDPALTSDHGWACL
jgi:hypothetical protein